jgi:putative oxidoreductase
MAASRSGLEGYAYAAMRIVTGFLFLFHGLQKVMGMFGGPLMPTGSLPWVAGVIELVGGTLVAIGFFASPVALLCSGEMSAAYFMAHQPKGTWPIQNQGELAALYCFVFLYISARGSGPLSVDRVLRRKL